MMETDREIIERYTNLILKGEFKWKSADVSKGEVGSSIKEAINRLRHPNEDIEIYYKTILLKFAIEKYWNEFKPMRWFLKDPWEKWNEYLKMRLW